MTINQVSGKDFVPSSELSKSSKNDVDIWVLAATFGLVQFVHDEMKAYRLYTVVPRLVEFIEELTNWYVRLNRDRLKGVYGEEEALLGLNVLFEVMITMTLIMSPFTPFFTEYLYQHLRKLMPLYGNTDASVPVDSIGKSASVHFLMLPTLDESRLNKIAESRFKTLQIAVSLARVARERRKIRNNLPLKNVVVVAANEADVEALTYLRSYFMAEINAWDVTLSTEWERLCVLKTQPDWKLLGKRLGKSMKAVASAVSALTQAEIIAFMKSGVITLEGFQLTTEEIVVKREFSGDSKVYEAAVSDDGSLLVAVDTTCDEEVFQELRAKTLAATIQKLRKSAGLVVQDRVEIYFSESGDGDLVGKAVGKHAESTVKRVKSLPLPVALMPKSAFVIAKEVVKDADLSKGEVTVFLTRPCVSVDTEALVTAGLTSSPHMADMTAMFLQTMDLDKVLEQEAIDLEVDGCRVRLVKEKHFFASGCDLVKACPSIRQKYSWLPTEF